MNGCKRPLRRRLRRGNMAISFAAGLGGTAVVTACLLLLIGALGGSSEKADPEDQVSDAVDELFAALAGGSFADTYRNNTTNHFREATPRGEYLERGERILSDFGSLKSKTSTKFELFQLPTGMQAVAFYDGEFEKGPGVIMTEFRKVDKKWLLLNFAVDKPKPK
jgi:hypothetical protein